MDSETQTGIRRAVAAAEFGKASALWEIYAAQLTEKIRSRTCSAAQLAQMRELIDWTRGIVTCAHAHAQRRINTRLTGLHVATVYAREVR
jgi:hypothetical protein